MASKLLLKSYACSGIWEFQCYTKQQCSFYSYMEEIQYLAILTFGLTEVSVLKIVFLFLACIVDGL